MHRITARTVEGQTIDLCYDPQAAEGQRYAVDGRLVLQAPRLAGEVWELWVPCQPQDRPTTSTGSPARNCTGCVTRKTWQTIQP